MRKSILRVQARAVMHRGAVLHASAVRSEGAALVFSAPSGGGKSTAAAVLGREGFEVLGDDSVIVCRGTDGVWRVIPCASWSWVRGGRRPEPAHLGAFILLEKGEPPVLSVLSPLYASYRMLRDSSVMAFEDVTPPERSALRQAVREMCEEFPVYVARYSLQSSLAGIVRRVSR